MASIISSIYSGWQSAGAFITGADDTKNDINGGEQVVLILVGLVGSGKSAFAAALEEHFPFFRRCNQDDLGDRRQVEHLARNSLRQGLSVCIDRTNFNESQRAYWIDIAREYPKASRWVIVFDTPYEVCAARLRERTSHPTITSPEQGLSILARFASDYRPPAVHEGYDRIISLSPSDHSSSTYTKEDVMGILQRVQNSPQVTRAAAPHADRRWGQPSRRGDHRQGYPSEGYRGRGYPSG
ncbi:hypothetical protein HGRIS_004716 [Hohenbuehelia grisea]|uniref:P-loop containing nucleoside triphosphate hydrolase protein n=1 Tax=Hohenbuehelia grisea TaxID=104357 RepID=A0ABR3JDZ5_9AGAR